MFDRYKYRFLFICCVFFFSLYWLVDFDNFFVNEFVDVTDASNVHGVSDVHGVNDNHVNETIDEEIDEEIDSIDLDEASSFLYQFVIFFILFVFFGL